MRLKYMFYTILKLFVVWLYYLNPLRRAPHTFIFFIFFLKIIIIIIMIILFPVIRCRHFGWHSSTRTPHSSSDRICRETLFPSLFADLKTTPSTRMETLYPTWVLAAISSPYGARHL